MVLLGVMCVIVAALLSAQGRAQTPPAVKTKKTVAAALDARIADVKWESMALDKALAELGEKGGVNIIMKWRTIEAANIPRNTIISLTAQKVTLAEALALLLSEASAGQQSPLAYYLLGENIVVTTAEEINRKVKVVRAYEVRDLLRVPEKGQEPMGPFGPRHVAPRNTQEEDEAKLALMTVVAEMVDKESWSGVGGTAWAAAGGMAFGRMGIFDGKLIVQSTGENQKAVEGFLERLRRR
jgi:hypothetical protein